MEAYVAPNHRIAKSSSPATRVSQNQVKHVQAYLKTAKPYALACGNVQLGPVQASLASPVEIEQVEPDRWANTERNRTPTPHID